MSDITLGEYAMIWIEEHKRYTKESTYNNYRNLIDNHIARDFKDTPISDLNHKLLQEYVIKKLECGSVTGKAMKTKSVRDIIVIFKLIVRAAFKEEVIPVFDTAIKFPKRTENAKPSFITNNDIKKIINSINLINDHRQIGFLLSLYTGMRIGEIAALTYQDIDTDSKVIIVSKTLQRTYNKTEKSRIIITAPKTRSSFREVPIPAQLEDKLIHFKNEHNYIISNTLTPVEPRYLRHLWSIFLKDNNIKHYSFHSLRHTFASKCIEAGIDFKTVSELLGHSNINTTMNLYVHPNKRQKEKAINKLTSFIN